MDGDNEKEIKSKPSSKSRSFSGEEYFEEDGDAEKRAENELENDDDQRII